MGCRVIALGFYMLHANKSCHLSIDRLMQIITPELMFQSGPFDRYYMVGGSDPGIPGGSTGSGQSQAASKVFGPGVIGSDPTLGEDTNYPPWPMGGLRGPADDTSQQTGVSQVGASDLVLSPFLLCCADRCWHLKSPN